jgi:dihydrofolate reductase
MRRVVVSEFVSLDGVMEDPGGGEKFKHGGWTWPYFNDEMGAFKIDELAASDALLLGRITYDGFAAAWPGRTDESGFADRMNSYRKYVASTTLKELMWNNSQLLGENVADEVATLKQQDGRNILVYGSAMLVQYLMQHNLVDEYRLLVFPVVLGSGKRLFRSSEDKFSLNLVEAKSFSSGVAGLIYQK